MLCQYAATSGIMFFSPLTLFDHMRQCDTPAMLSAVRGSGHIHLITMVLALLSSPWHCYTVIELRSYMSWKMLLGVRTNTDSPCKINSTPNLLSHGAQHRWLLTRLTASRFKGNHFICDVLVCKQTWLETVSKWGEMVQSTTSFILNIPMIFLLSLDIIHGGGEMCGKIRLDSECWCDARYRACVTLSPGIHTIRDHQRMMTILKCEWTRKQFTMRTRGSKPNVMVDFLPEQLSCANYQR